MKKGLEYFQKVLKRQIPDFWKGKSLKLLFRDGGVSKYTILFYLNTYVCIIIAGLNLINCISENRDFSYYIIYVGIFILFAIVNVICKNKNYYKWNSIFYAVIGIGTLIGNDIGNYSGAVFIIFSVHIYNSWKTNIILTILLILSSVAKNIFFDYGIVATVNLMVVYAVIIFIYYILIHPKKKIQSGPEIICTELEQEDIQILQYLYEGYSIKEISDRIYITPGAINKRMSRAKETMNAKSREHLLAICREKRFIRLNVDK